MGVCVFVASGLNFDMDGYLAKSPFKTMSVFRKGDIPPKDNPQRQPRADSGFTVLVAQSQGAGLSKEVPEALLFLSRHKQEMLRLRNHGVDNLLFDFGMESQGMIQQAEYLPPELIAALARFDMGLIFSTVQIPKG
jgi:hypothetical protein